MTEDRNVTPEERAAEYDPSCPHGNVTRCESENCGDEWCRACCCDDCGLTYTRIAQIAADEERRRYPI